MLKKAKAESITKMIEDCNRDSKKLYNLASLLMEMVKENSLSDHTDKEELADQFASFFITKIQKIRDQLDSLPTYSHTSSNPPEFLEFELMLEEEVEVLSEVCQPKCVICILSQPHFSKTHYLVYFPQ